MASQKRKFETFYESMLFNFNTSTRASFQDGRIRPIIKTIYEPKPLSKKVNKGKLKYVYSFSEWKEPVPFDIFLKPKEIIRTHPGTIQKRYETPPDLKIEEIRKTRPRLVMTPAACVDDADPEARNLLNQEVYVSSAQIMQREVVNSMTTSNVISPLTGTLAPANPISLKKSDVPYVSPEWRMDSVSWDSRQLRCHCSYDSYFWSKRTPKCAICEATFARNRRKMAPHK